jgi:autotransporter-associated beta strand protein
MRIHRRSIAGTAARFGTLLLPAALAAATYQWTGAVSDAWSNSNNWSPAGVPASGDDLVFPHNAIRKTTRNTLGNDFRPRSLRFTGATANYVVQGDRIHLSTAPGDNEVVRLIDEHTSGNLRFEADLSIAGNLEFQVAGSLGFYGTLTGASASRVRFTGSGSVETWGPLDAFFPVSELPSFTVAGNTENTTLFAMRLEGDGQNLYLARPGGILGWSGDVYVGDPTAPAREMTVWPLFENAFGQNLHLRGGGRLVMNDKSQSVNWLRFDTGGVADTGTAALHVFSAISTQGTPTATRTATLRGRLGIATTALQIQNGDAFPLQSPRDQTNLFLANLGLQSALNLEASVFGSPLSFSIGEPGIQKLGSSVLRLLSGNTYAGPTHVEQGLIDARHASALGTTDGPTTIHRNGGVLLNGIASAEPFFFDEQASMFETITTRVPELFPQLLSTGNAEASGPLTFDVDAAISAAPGTLTLSGPFAGTGNLHLNYLIPPAANLVDSTTNGIIRLTGSTPNAHTGTTRIHRGRVELARTVGTLSIPGDLVVGNPEGSPTLLDVQNPLQIRVGRALHLHPGATLRTPATHFRSIEGEGQIDVGSSYASVGIADTDSSFAGSITGSSAVAKVGSGLWTLTGTNSVPGKIELTEGTVSITGKLDALDIKADGTGIATLAGSGTARDLALGPRGRISPGSGNGVETLARLTVRNLRIVDPSAVARFDLAGSTVLTGHDQVRATDVVQLGGRLALFTSYTPAPGDRLRLIDKTSAGPITGTFENLSEAGTVTNQALIWKATYTGGDGNDFVLEFVGTTNPPPNLPPVLTSPATLQLTEGVPASLQVSATDPNPGQTVRFRLDANAPVGAAIDRDSGRLLWTPGERQGGRTFDFGIVALDDAVPALRVTNRISVSVLESNLPPTLTVQPRHTATEGTEFILTPSATDLDEPAQQLVWDLVGPTPNGLTVDPTTGTLRWTPGELQAPATNEVTLRVRDDGTPRASATRTLRLITTEQNESPTLTPPTDLTVVAGDLLTTEVSATDHDRPLQNLRFRAAGPVPEGLTIHPVTGRIRWTPTDAQVGVHLLRIAVTDDGSPALEDLGRFQITVQPAPVAVRLQAVLDTTASPPEVQISWPAAATDFELQFNPDPTNDAGWQPIANPGTILTEGNRRLFRPPAGANARFYRLHRPPPTGN